MKRAFILIVILGIGFLALAPMVRSLVASIEMKGGRPAEIVVSPEEIQKFLGLDEVHTFSHDKIFFDTKPASQGSEFVELDLAGAIDRTLKNHLWSRTAHEQIEESLGKRWQAMSSLLPHIDGSMSEQRTWKENLSALGFKGVGMIGPFNTFDARFRLVQKILDLSALSEFQAGRKNVNVARYNEELAHQQVVLIASLAYLDALRAQGTFKAAQANLELSERLLKQARNQWDAGVAASVDVARAETRVAQDKLWLEKARLDTHDAYLELQRVTGLPYDSILRLVDTLCFVHEKLPPIKDALTLAREGRMEMRIALEKIQVLKYQLYGARAQSLPKVEFGGGYGLSGNDPGHGGGSRPTGDAFFQVTVPLFEGGLIHGKVKEAASQKKQEEIYYDDLQRQVDEDVHKALWTVDTSLEQVHAASQVVHLADRELQLASHRFAEGVGDNVEVVNAQAALAQARDEYIGALVQYHTARINWYFALGNTDAFYLQDAKRKGSH